MSTPLETAPEAFTADGGTRTERLHSWWKKKKFWLVIGVIFVLVTVGGLILSNSGRQDSSALSISNPAPEGAQAAASVLRNQGVKVTAADSLDATMKALSANGEEGSTVLFFDPKSLLKPTQVAELAQESAKNGAKIVAVVPGTLAVKNLSAELSGAGSVASSGQALQANCTNPDASIAGSIVPTEVQGSSTDSTTLKIYRGTEVCFVPAGSAGTSGIMASTGGGDVTVLGSTALLSNSNLASQGNAALTFNLLGKRPHLIWYTASLKDVPVTQEQPSLAELTPSWIFPAMAWLLLVGMLGMVWRGRRYGPLVIEPLPVVVKASETVTGRARLYQDARAIDTVARTFQEATLTRLAKYLRLGSSASPESVVEALTAHTGRSRPELFALLLHDVPRNEKEMLSMATALADLEEEVVQQ